VVFNSHTWHGGTLNRTDKPRRALHSYFCRRSHPQQLNQRQYLSPATIASFGPEIRYLLDVES
jgi:ectoine hydroxylase-related dioxygenase (phytanoyl-CoA dioxygenase family)